jgi:hypothetical protein
MSYFGIGDYQNVNRYLLPFENSLVFFLLMNIWYNLNYFKKYFILIKIKYIYIVTFFILVTNLSLSGYKIDFLKRLYNDRIESALNILNIKNLTNKETFFYKINIFNEKNNKNYINLFNSCLKNQNFSKKILILIKHAYLFKNKNIQVIENKYGFTMSKKIYPIFQSYDYKLQYFNKNYNYILIKKELLFESDEITRYVRDYKKIKINNLFIINNFFTDYNKYGIYPRIAWLDLAGF